MGMVGDNAWRRICSICPAMPRWTGPHKTQWPKSPAESTTYMSVHGSHSHLLPNWHSRPNCFPQNRQKPQQENITSITPSRCPQEWASATSSPAHPLNHPHGRPTSHACTPTQTGAQTTTRTTPKSISTRIFSQRQLETRPQLETCPRTAPRPGPTARVIPRKKSSPPSHAPRRQVVSPSYPKSTRQYHTRWPSTTSTG